MARGTLIRKLAEFAAEGEASSPETYALYFLNWISAAMSGAHENAADILAEFMAQEGTGNYQPLGRNENLRPSDCAAIDCFSSAIQAYDDIHFETTTHPCGPVAAAICAVIRKQETTLKELLDALCIGMETECRCARALFSHGSSGWYTTGIAGVIGAAAAVARLLKFNAKQMENAMALAASTASGNRGTHGSMAGSYIPAFAAKNGYDAAMMSACGFTCSSSALDGTNGLIACIDPDADIEKALQSLGTEFISLKTSCKPYPYGFISYGLISCFREKREYRDVEEVICTVSKRCAQLGANPFPKTMYEGFVSLPYITAKAILDPESLCIPLSEHLTLSEAERELISKIRIEEDQNMNDQSASVTIRTKNRIDTLSSFQPSGTAEYPMTKEDILHKVRSLNTVDEVLIKQLEEPETYYNYVVRITDRVSLEKNIRRKKL